MKRRGNRRKIGRAAALAALAVSSCLLSAWHLGAGNTAAGGWPGGVSQVLAVGSLDPAYERYVAGRVNREPEAEKPQMLLLSELAGSDAIEDAAGQAGVQSGTEQSGGAGQTGEAGRPGETGQSGSASQGSDGSIQTALSLIGAQYSAAQLADFQFLVDHFYTVHSTTTIRPDQLNGADYLARDLTLAVDGAAPQVLIYHTHYSEMYADSTPGDLTTGVIGVGNYLAELLTSRYGLNVIHDTTPYEYTNSYSLAEARVREILAAYPSIQVVIDLHRDAIGDQKLTTTVNGKSTAKIMFFNGMCQTTTGPTPHLSNPYLADNLAFSLQMKMVAEAYYPGLARKNYLKPYQYNLHMRPLSTLVEVGSDTNTFEEAKNAMEPFADILGKVLVKN